MKRSVLLICAFCLFSLQALANNDAIDAVGPLAVRIQRPAIGPYGAGGYADLSEPGNPLAVPVTLTNNADVAISGTLRVRVIDEWKVDPPTPIRFHVGPHESSRLEFTVEFGEGTYAAHYPIHAYAEFEYAGHTLIAHPVLILQTQIATSSLETSQADSKPFPVPTIGTVALWRLPVHKTRVSIEDSDQADSLGQEKFEAKRIISFGSIGSNGDHRGIAMRLGTQLPSGREKVTDVSVDFPLSLPQTHPLSLKLDLNGRADYAVQVATLPQAGWSTVFSREAQAEANHPAVVSLDQYSGKEILIRLEARNATGEVRWNEPTLVAGTPPASAAFPPRGGDSRFLGRIGDCEVRVWPGSRGLLDAPVGFVCRERSLYFRGFRIRVGGEAIEDWESSATLVASKVEQESDHFKVRHSIRCAAGTFDVLTELWVDHDALRAKVWLENVPPSKPWSEISIESVSAGPWSEKARRVYAGPGNVIENPEKFWMPYDGHWLSTSFVGFDFANGQSLVQNSEAISDGLDIDPVNQVYSLVTPHSQVLEFFPARDVFSAVKTLRSQDTRKPSGGVKSLAGRFTFDLWSGRYDTATKDMERAAEYGITNALVIWHRWQRWGYDNRLPDIYPPNIDLGSLEDFRQLVEFCKRNRTLFAPHDNYFDFYPNSEDFTYSSIVFRQAGVPFKAWFNYDYDSQAYRARPDRVLSYVQRNLKQVKEGFAPNAYFIDVWANAAPYDYWTSEGKLIDRGETQRFWGEAFNWIRNYLGDQAPQLSEAGNDKLIGWLDGADAQQLRVDSKEKGFVWNIRCTDSERIPWIDVAWHDKFILHGAGYEERYAGGLDLKEHGAYSDDYLSTEVLSGRPLMVPQVFNRDVVRVYWLLNDAMGALALDRIDSVQFDGDDIHRQHVHWERGGDVWVNRGKEQWTIQGHTLPQFGFFLKIGQIQAAVETVNGKRSEWSKSPNKRYVDGQLFSVTSEPIKSLPAAVN